MGLYNDIAERLANGARTAYRDSISRLGSAGLSAAIDGVNAYMPTDMQIGKKFGSRTITGIGKGIKKAGRGISNKGIPEEFWTTETPCMGGITPKEARQIIEDAIGQNRSKKNLWRVEVSSKLDSGELNLPTLFNLFATELSYSAVITGEATKIGGANYDVVQGVEPVELSLTTYDDRDGTLKKWFLAHQSAAVSRDGTVSEPDSYAVKIRVLHGFINRPDAGDPFETVGLFRPTNMELTLSRSEDGLEEIQMTFTQLDTFMVP